MKSHETQAPEITECANPFWELIPWYVNGSLPENDQQAVEQHARTCPFCTREIDRQRHLAKKVAVTELVEVEVADNWQRLRAQVEADVQARAPRKQGWRGFGALRGGLLTAAGAVAAACVVVVLQLTPPQHAQPTKAGNL